MSEQTALTWGELKAFAESHNLADDAEIRVEMWDDQHEETFEQPATSAAVKAFMNQHAELVLHADN